MKILVVEDNEIIAEGLKYSLECERYSVDISNSIKTAKENIANNLYSLIILDIIIRCSIFSIFYTSSCFF